MFDWVIIKGDTIVPLSRINFSLYLVLRLSGTDSAYTEYKQNRIWLILVLSNTNLKKNLPISFRVQQKNREKTGHLDLQPVAEEGCLLGVDLAELGLHVLLGQNGQMLVQDLTPEIKNSVADLDFAFSLSAHSEFFGRINLTGRRLF